LLIILPTSASHPNLIDPLPFQDYDALYKSGASAIFGPGTKLPVAALEVVNLISGHLEKQKYAEKNLV